MISYDDCIGLVGLEQELVDAVIAHEHLPAIAAVEKVAAFLDQAWGHAAVRQMVMDDIAACAAREDQGRLHDLESLLERTARQFPETFDRRHHSRDATVH